MTALQKLAFLVSLLASSIPAEAWQSNFAEKFPAVAKAETARVEAIRKASRASICIFAPDATNGGSGVIISPDGYAVTNYHVADPCGTWMLVGRHDGTVCHAIIVGIDPVGDLALIKLLDRKELPYADFADSNRLKVGDPCFAVGNPFLLASDFQMSISSGIVSGIHRYQFPAGTLLEYADCIQTDAAINPGNSGGPLFGFDGKVIGINGRGSFEKRGRVNVGVGYAISANQVKNFLGSLKSGRILDHATAGFTVADHDSKGARVDDISNDSDAYRKGLRFDDVVLQVADRKITSANDFKNIIGTFPAHWQVPIHIRTRTIDDVVSERVILVRLSPVHSPQDLFSKVNSANQNPNRKIKRKEKHAPANLAELHEARQGFANYKFNRSTRTEILSNLYNKNDLKRPLTGKLSLAGKSSQSDFEIVFADKQSGLKLGEDVFTLDETSPYENQITPLKSGGLLNAFSLWQQVLFRKTNDVTITYLGTAPNVFQSPDKLMRNWSKLEMLDLLLVRKGGTESWFYLNSKSQIVACEFFPYPESDPAILVFDEFKKGSQGLLPQKVTARYRQQVYAEFEIESYQSAIPKSNAETTDAP